METQRKIREFLESPLARKALNGLKSNARMTLNVNGETLLVHPENGRIMLDTVEKGTASDLEFWADRELLIEILQKAQERDMEVGEFGVLLFQSMWDKKNQGRVRFKIHASIPTLLFRGYFTVLMAGGPVVMKFLATHGLDSLGKIKKALKG